MVAQADLWRQLENMARDKKNVPKKKRQTKERQAGEMVQRIVGPKT